MNFLQRKDCFIFTAISIVALVCFLPGLNIYGMLDPTDSFFFEVPREMIELNHYATPIYNYTDWLDKPAFPFWLIVLSYKFFGINDFAARLPAALSGIILVIATYLVPLKIIGRRATTLSALILTSSPLFVIVGHVALSDEALSMLSGISMLLIGATLASNKQRINLLAYFFLALAILCKGPIALVFVVGATSIYLFLTNNSFHGVYNDLLKLKLVVAILILMILCLPYYIWAHVTTSGAFTDQFFLRQNLGRLTGTVNHLEPIWFYLPVFFAGYFPWCWYLLFSFSWLKKVLVSRFELTQRQKFIIFCLCWFLFLGALFTLIPTKLPTYIIPFSPALAIVTGCYLDVFLKAKTVHKQSSLHKRGLAKNIMIGFPTFLIPVAAGIVLFILISKLGKNPVSIGLSLGLIIAAALSLLSLNAFWSEKYINALLSLCIASIFGCVVLVPSAFYWFYESHQMVMNKMIAIVKKKDAHLATLFSPVPSVVFYLHRQVPNLESLDELGWFCKQGKGPHYLLASRNCLQIPKLKAKEHVVNTNGKWYLLDVEGFPWTDNLRP